MSLEKRKQGGYLAAGLGSFTGAFLLAALGIFLGINYAKYFMPYAELGGLIPPLFGLFLGWWIGEVMGCWLALRWRGYRRANQTAILLAILTPFTIFLWMVFHTTLFNLFRGNMNDLEFSALDQKIRPITASLTAIGLALLARFLTSWKQQHHN